MSEIRKITDRLELLPVLEFSPWDYAPEPIEIPSIDDIPARSQYWLTALSNDGITGLTPIYPGSWLVTATQVVDAHILNRFVHARFKDHTPELLAEYDDDRDVLMRSFSNSGYVLKWGDEILVEPQCCSDLEKIVTWADIASYRGDAWETFWMGHPWLYVRFEDDWLWFSDYHDDYLSLVSARFAVLPNALQEAVTAAQSEVDAWYPHLESAFANFKRSHGLIR